MIGTDISPIQPSWLPPNLRFEMDDATLDWTFKPDSFDFIHMRYLFGSIADWPALYKEAYRACKPGGYLEDFEASVVMASDDGTVAEGSAMNQWGKVFHEGGRKFGRSFSVLEDDVQKKAMEGAGFTNIDVWDFKVSYLPHNDAPGRGGAYALTARRPPVPNRRLAARQEAQGAGSLQPAGAGAGHRGLRAVHVEYRHGMVQG